MKVSQKFSIKGSLVLKCAVAAVLMIVESYFVYTHFRVVNGLSSIQGIPLILRKAYFGTDMISVVATFFLTGKQNITLSAIHFIVHSTACLHLFEMYQNVFYQEVFRLAELEESSSFVTSLYVFLTYADIACHSVNVILLYRLLSAQLVYDNGLVREDNSRKQQQQQQQPQPHEEEQVYAAADSVKKNE